MSTEKGVKLDDGKLRWDLVPVEELEGIAEVMTFGANKYTDNGWQSVPNAIDRYYAALIRHLISLRKGEEYDVDSGLRHIDHVKTNAVFLGHLMRREQ